MPENLIDIAGIVTSVAKGASEAIDLMRDQKVSIELGEFEITLRLNADLDAKSLEKPARGKTVTPIKFTSIKSVSTLAPKITANKPGAVVVGSQPASVIPEEINLEIRVLLIPSVQSE